MTTLLSPELDLIADQAVVSALRIQAANRLEVERLTGTPKRYQPLVDRRRPEPKPEPDPKAADHQRDLEEALRGLPTHRMVMKFDRAGDGIRLRCSCKRLNTVVDADDMDIVGGLLHRHAFAYDAWPASGEPLRVQDQRKRGLPPYLLVLGDDWTPPPLI